MLPPCPALSTDACRCQQAAVAPRLPWVHGALTRGVAPCARFLPWRSRRRWRSSWRRWGALSRQARCGMLVRIQRLPASNSGCRRALHTPHACRMRSTLPLTPQIRHVGLSNETPWGLMKCLHLGTSSQLHLPNFILDKACALACMLHHQQPRPRRCRVAQPKRTRACPGWHPCRTPTGDRRAACAGMGSVVARRAGEQLLALHTPRSPRPLGRAATV